MSKKKINKIYISKEQENIAVQQIIDYFENEHSESIGDLKAMLILSFFMEKVAPVIYNQGVLDSQKFLNEKVADLYELIKD